MVYDRLFFAMEADEKKRYPRRGLASASEEVRQRVAQMGGYALHQIRGLQAAPAETRIRVSKIGGHVSGEIRRARKQTTQTSAQQFQ